MAKGRIVALGIGIIIGAAGMWFVDKSKEPQIQVDEIVEGYTTTTPVAPAPAAAPATTDSMNTMGGHDQHTDMNTMGNNTDATPAEGQ